jgi:hypothetical protein
MSTDPAHAAAVRAWAAAMPLDAVSDVVIRAFERAFNAVWARAHITLGEVTLIAIVDRVLFDAAQHHPMMAAIELQPTGFTFDRLLVPSQEPSTADIAAALEAVLVDLLTVIGRLTAEILTPALHAALSAVALPPRAIAPRDEREDGRS